MLTNKKLLALFFIMLAYIQTTEALSGLLVKSLVKQAPATEPTDKFPTFTDEELLDFYFELRESQEKKSIPEYYYLENSFPPTSTEGSSDHQRERLMDALRHTTTIFGHAALVYTLENLSQESALLAKREAFVQELTTNKELFKKIETILNRIKKVQAGYFSFLTPEKAETTEAINLINQKIPARFKNNPVAAHVVLYATNAKKLYDTTPFIRWYAYIAAARAVWDKVRRGEPFFQKFPFYLVNHAKNVLSTPKELLPVLVWYGGLIVLIQAFTLGVGVKGIYRLYTTLSSIQKRCMAVGRIFSGCSQLYLLSTKHKTMAEGLSLLTNLQSIVNHSGMGDFGQLVSLLSTKTFKGLPSFFSFTGRIIPAYNLIREQKGRIVPALAAIGEIDACLAQAKLHLSSLVSDDKE